MKKTELEDLLVVLKQAVTIVENDLKKAGRYQDPGDLVYLDDLIDLDAWLHVYGTEERPARAMFSATGLPEYTRQELLYVTRQLKEYAELDREGRSINGTHLWTYLGKKNYGRDGKIDLFACIPFETDAE